MLPERCLHRVELLAVGKAFDGRNLAALYLYSEQAAAFNRPTVDVDNAGPALACIAANMRSRHAERFAEQVDQEGPRFNPGIDRLSVQAE